MKRLFRVPRLIVLSAFICLLSGCTNDGEATRILTAQGYSNIRMTGFNFFACGRDDFYHTGFAATSPTGQQVNGTVCSGLLFKGATVRFD